MHTAGLAIYISIIAVMVVLGCHKEIKLYPTGAEQWANLLDDIDSTYWTGPNSGGIYFYYYFSPPVYVTEIQVRAYFNNVDSIVITVQNTKVFQSYYVNGAHTNSFDTATSVRVDNIYAARVQWFFVGESSAPQISTAQVFGCYVTSIPTASPSTIVPTLQPSSFPTVSPTILPTTVGPSSTPSLSPTVSPTKIPTTDVSAEFDGLTIQIGSFELLVLAAVVFGVVFVLPMAVFCLIRRSRSRKQLQVNKILNVREEGATAELCMISDVEVEMHEEGQVVKLMTEELKVNQ